MNSAEMIELCKKHTLYSWSSVDGADPLPIARAEGVYLYTPDNKRILDFNSQLMCVNIGHGHRRVIDAIKKQLDELIFVYPGTATAIRAQVFASDGTRLGNEFLVNTTTTNIQFEPAITGLSDGRFVVSWTDLSQSGGDQSGYAVRAQIFEGDGTRSGAEFLVNTTTASIQEQSSLAALPGGRFVAVWADTSDPATGFGVRV